MAGHHYNACALVREHSAQRGSGAIRTTMGSLKIRRQQGLYWDGLVMIDHHMFFNLCYFSGSMELNVIDDS